MIIIKQKGNFKKTDGFLGNLRKNHYVNILEKYGQQGVTALSIATPQDTGETSSSWSYEVTTTKQGYVLTWSNSNVVDGVPVAILIQYGHATKNGGYVQGRDYINPALQPIFDKIADEAWKEVTKL